MQSDTPGTPDGVSDSGSDAEDASGVTLSTGEHSTFDRSHYTHDTLETSGDSDMEVEEPVEVAQASGGVTGKGKEKKIPDSVLVNEGIGGLGFNFKRAHDSIRATVTSSCELHSQHSTNKAPSF